MFYPVILAGGSGERFWPLSRKHKPKQFLTLEAGGRSLIQVTADRLSALSEGMDQLLVVTANDQRSNVLEHLPELPLENLLVEPVARDTAAAILYGALTIARDEPDAIMGVFPADHRVDDPEAFSEVLRRAIAYAQAHDDLVTIGMTPQYPATGYGYIEQGPEQLDAGQLDAGQPASGVYRVQRFAEKPDAETARQFLATGRYLWNSGMFVWRVQSILRAFETLAPELYGPMAEAARIRGGLRAAYPGLPKISVDYAILERARNVVVIPASFGWDDLGDWNALERLLKGDASGDGSNVAVGRTVSLDTGGAILYTTGGDDLIATIGLEDVVVVRAGDVTLVVRKDRTQDIKTVVQQLKKSPELERFA
ncbi:mannose-1-phosphate guanylyltransferase [Deinococcus koreensis]|uniref:mannose-1-phosphate guanylyltransferase n=1 Tax=Deinococcus koreensis TaxID=2054903 RepID=A0A2K3UTC4_9DEIO|nr:mannose-1-phosphate guanylyltransferase [Deinococcus koreensis]PNY79792.1 mannose-1-phosphate guanylyltransferase [Deinococcus koreensis]